MTPTVGLITIHGIINYGSSLQTYALVKTVQSLGYSCELIDYKYPTEYHLTNAPYYKDKVVVRKMSFIDRLINKILLLLLKDTESIKINRFNEFINKNINLTNKYPNAKSIMDDPPIYDIYLTGSDQVWNPLYCHDDITYILPFAPENSKRISYSASFGSSTILPQYENIYKNALRKYDNISVREESGIKIINDLVGLEATCVLDPTLLFNEVEWSKVATEPDIDEPYILCYLLGYSFNPFPFVDKLVAHLHKITGFKVVMIGGDLKNILKGYKVVRDAGPKEFLGLFKKASFVVTTSFHGTAFALNFSKPFFSVINNKPSSDDRQINILKKLGAENRILPLGSSMPEISLVEMDYSTISIKLVEERSKSLNYLKSALAL